jgi:carbamoyl-phosphate synthase large subunit
MITILLTAIGGDIAQAVAAIIHETNTNWRLIGMDMNDRHAGELFVDRLYRSPAASDASYDDWLNDLINREKIDFCIPLSEAELLHFAQQRKEKIACAKFVMPNFRTIEIGTDKLATSTFLELIGCPKPWTISSEEVAENVPLPCIFKPKRSAGSKSIFLCKTFKEIAFYREHYPGGVVQEYLLPEDKEVTCAVYRTQTGTTAVLQLLRSLVGGFTSWARVIEDTEIAKQCIKVAEGLDLKGAINVQLRLTDRGPRIFEINPRFSSTVLIRHRMGFQDVVWTIQELMGEKVYIKYPPVGTTAVRLQGAELLDNGPKGTRRGASNE